MRPSEQKKLYDEVFCEGGHKMNGQGKTRINIWAIIGAVVCVGVIIVGIVIYNDIGNNLNEATIWLMICFGAVMGIFFASKVIEKAPLPSPELEAILARLDSGITGRTLSEQANGFKTREEQREQQYSELLSKMSEAKTSSEFNELVNGFKSLGDYKDSQFLAYDCSKKASAFLQAESASSTRTSASLVAFDLTKPVLNAVPPKDEDFKFMTNCSCTDCGQSTSPMITVYINENDEKKKTQLCRQCFMERLTEKYNKEKFDSQSN